MWTQNIQSFEGYYWVSEQSVPKLRLWPRLNHIMHMSCSYPQPSVMYMGTYVINSPNILWINFRSYNGSVRAIVQPWYKIKLKCIKIHWLASGSIIASPFLQLITSGIQWHYLEHRWAYLLVYRKSQLDYFDEWHDCLAEWDWENSNIAVV